MMSPCLIKSTKKGLIEMDYCIDRKEVARLLGVSVPTVYRLIKFGANGRPPLPHMKVGRSVRIKITDFEAWLETEPKPVKPVRGRPLGSTKAAMTRRRAEAQAEMAMSPT